MFWLATVTCYSQDSLGLHKNVKYYNTFTTGALYGDDEKAITASLLTTHGISFNRWRAGAGVGLEGYDGWKIMPVFASLSFDFYKTENNALFIKLNAGHAFGWRLVQVEGTAVTDERGGLMINPMLGYRIHEKRISLYIEAGYKQQHTRYSFHYRGWGPSRYTIDEELNRFYLLIGFGLN